MDFSNIYDDLILKTGKLAVVGLGYVGITVAVEFAKYVNVIGFDIDEARLNEYRQGIDATCEVNDKIKNSAIDFTSDPKRLREASFIIVAVPTPVNKNKVPDLSLIESASVTIGKNLSNGSIIVYESTVYPGVTENICIPIIERESGLKCGVDWKIGYSPERINPGDKVHTLSSVCKIVSGMDTESESVIQMVYNIVVKAGTLLVSDIKTAEAVKVIENTQRDVNVAFMNEIALVCHKLGIDTHEVIKGMNTKWNALGFVPGLVGGHCISVDPYYLVHVAEKSGYHSDMFSKCRQINEGIGSFIADSAVNEMIRANKVFSAKNTVVVILGIAFKENCPDIRNSGVMDVVNRLNEYGITPFIYDPWVNAEEVKKEYNVYIMPIDNIPKADCVIVAVGHNEFRALTVEQIKMMFKNELPDNKKVFVDVKHIYDTDELKNSGITFWRL